MQVQSLSVTMFCFAPVTLISQETNGNVVIFRGETDRFTNTSGNNCNQCQCMMNHTFVQTRGKYGECVSKRFGGLRNM